jgi:hypothetical protein
MQNSQISLLRKNEEASQSAAEELARPFIKDYIKSICAARSFTQSTKNTVTVGLKNHTTWNYFRSSSTAPAATLATLHRKLFSASSTKADML